MDKEVHNMRTNIWQSDNGTVVCTNHLGEYALTALQQRPHRNTITTPLDRWTRMTAVELDDWMWFLAHNGHHQPCEKCRLYISK